jgi:preprotein translocase subunit YajC
MNIMLHGSYMEVSMQFFNVLMSATTAAAKATTAAADKAADPTASLLSQMMPILLLVGVFGVMYFIMIRPQRKRDKELKAQVSKMAVGDTVVTIGGLVGTIANIQDDNITMTTSIAHTMVTYKKSAISTIIPRQ